MSGKSLARAIVSWLSVADLGGVSVAASGSRLRLLQHGRRFADINLDKILGDCNDAIGYASALYAVLDSLQDCVIDLTTSPWPIVGDPPQMAIPRVERQGDTVVAGYGLKDAWADAPLRQRFDIQSLRD